LAPLDVKKIRIFPSLGLDDGLQCACFPPLYPAATDPSKPFVESLRGLKPDGVLEKLRQLVDFHVFLRVRMIRRMMCGSNLRLDRAYPMCGYRRFTGMSRAMSYCLSEAPLERIGHTYATNPYMLHEVLPSPDEDTPIPATIPPGPFVHEQVVMKFWPLSPFHVLFYGDDYSVEIQRPVYHT